MSRFQIIIEHIARENGSTASEVLLEMQNAIDSAYANRSTDSQYIWDAMSLNSPHPTAEEFVAKAAAMILNGTLFSDAEQQRS